jgi:hypothetical protein
MHFDRYSPKCAFAHFTARAMTCGIGVMSCGMDVSCYANMMGVGRTDVSRTNTGITGEGITGANY